MLPYFSIVVVNRQYKKIFEQNLFTQKYGRIFDVFLTIADSNEYKEFWTEEEVEVCPCQHLGTITEFVASPQDLQEIESLVEKDKDGFSFIPYGNLFSSNEKIVLNLEDYQHKSLCEDFLDKRIFEDDLWAIARQQNLSLMPNFFPEEVCKNYFKHLYYEMFNNSVLILSRKSFPALQGKLAVHTFHEIKNLERAWKDKSWKQQEGSMTFREELDQILLNAILNN